MSVLATGAPHSVDLQQNQVPPAGTRSRSAGTGYGTFDTFATDDARTAHINGQIPAALAKVSADLLASDPDIRPVDVLAFK
jgi:hypothetical protein